ncbi:hypothetical protein Tco_0928307 [Tanacetum coccineum]
MMKNIQEALTTIENKARVQTCRNKPQVSSSVGSSIQNDAITALTKQVEALMQKEQEPETITEVVEIASSKSTPLVPPPETPPLSTPKSKIYGDVSDLFIFLLDIVDSLCDKFPIKNNYLSDNPTPSSDFVVESLSPLPIPYEDNDSLVEESDILIFSFGWISPAYYEAFYFDDKYIKEKSRRSTTTHSDYSLLEYDSFIFDLSIDPFSSCR